MIFRICLFFIGAQEGYAVSPIILNLDFFD